jgi:hypothetical protein
MSPVIISSELEGGENENEQKKLDRLRRFGCSCHHYGVELLRFPCMLPYVGVKQLYDLSMKPFIYLALLFDKNPILALAILPFIGLPIMLILVFVPLPNIIKIAITICAFVAFSLARDRN